MIQFPAWRTLTFVVYETHDDLVKAVKASGSEIGKYAREIIAKTPLAKEAIELELVLASACDLGITSAATTKTIFAAASERGLDRCPAEAGPQLRRQYPDQPKGEALWMAMEPIADFDGDPYVFLVERDVLGRWLCTNDGDADGLWPPDYVWVFARRKT